MKYSETEVALHIKGFDLNFCLVIGLFVLLTSCITSGLRFEKGHYKEGHKQIPAALNLEFIYLNKASKEEIVKDLEGEFRKYKNFNSDESSDSQKYIYNEQVSIPISFIKDTFRQNPDGSWTNGAPSIDEPPVYRH